MTGVQCLALCCLFGASVHAATVHGVIFDEETHNPLARTKVTLIPLPGNPVSSVSILSNDHGAYVFQGVQPGWYFIRATRLGFAVAEYGQSRPGLPGTPLEVVNEVAGNENSESRQIVMRHQAAITGSVLDDNSIGIAGWPVSVYTARQPIRRIAEGTTDDRGNFRVGELDPGAYIVRAGGGGLEDASTLVPTYYKYGTAVAAAEPVRVRLGETQGFIAIHTVEGQLFELTGEVTAPDNRLLRLTLITDTGRRLIANAAGPFDATGVPPGPVELLVESGPDGKQTCAGYQRILVDRNMFARVDCAPLAPPVVTGAANLRIIARHVDLDGPGLERTLSTDELLAPGRWEFTMRPDPQHYLVAIQNQADASASPPPVDGWFGLDIGNAPRLRVTLSDKPVSISGLVSSESKPVIGAPVYLALVYPGAPELSLQSWDVRSDAQGKYSFKGLPPGTYRLISGFDVGPDDPQARTRALELTLREGTTVTQALEMVLK